MTWSQLLPLILREGIPAAFELYHLVTTDREVTDEDWLRLLELSQKTPEQYKAEARARLAAARTSAAPHA